ncbi:efflux RND transporter periplasmic adaptor subunit [Moheibacter lacus]|uniref:Efflux RND transporter periplasmic adaptor subunit n=1 Tax=Moheibacter lacus TaxID=2745851 RepID=A0A838ZM06_9FLAO|nr:efflux RND transporter periplasmic adaptor subunit [Moheibacter lacus]MBA5628800.1 efflux RND transporter periplasmic adaptor subunit [Moheibacter lacus]
MKKLVYILLPILFVSTSISCKDDKKVSETEEHAEGDGHDHGSEEGHEHGEEESETEVTLTEAQVKAIKIEFGNIEMKELNDAIKANGFLKVPNQNKAQVTSLYSGQIKSIRVQPGDYIGKGQTIAVIENPGQVLVQENYLTVVGQIQMTQTEVKRQKELYEGNAGALKNLQYAESQLKTLQTQRASLAKQLQMMGIKPGSVSAKNLNSSMAVKAPISGVIGAVLVDIGAYVDVSFPIAEIVDNSNLHLDLGVFEKDLPKIKKRQLIHFTMTNNPEKEYDAEIFSIGSTFEDQSKAVPVHARVKGEKSGLIDGMNVVAVISVGKNLVPAVPTEAIVNVGAEDFIFIQKPTPHVHTEEEHEHEFTFERIPVVKGTTDVGFTQITPLVKIEDNAKIVSKGAFFILAKMNNSGEHSHSH